MGFGIADIVFPDKQKKCTEWLTAFTLNTSMTLVTAGVALLILIVNAKIPEFDVPPDFPLLNGKYVDFTVPWYRSVGTTLTIAMIMNIVTPHIAENMLFALPACRRCCDRKCTRDMKKTK